jgi:uncharacterized protein with GYD domain
MPKYLMEGSYTAEGVRGLAKEGATSRRKTIEELVASQQGKVEAFYYAFGRSDVVLIADLPDAATAAAFSIAVNQSGAVRLTSTPLMTVEEMDQATKKTIAYRPPGK